MVATAANAEPYADPDTVPATTSTVSRRGVSLARHELFVPDSTVNRISRLAVGRPPHDTSSRLALLVT